MLIELSQIEGAMEARDGFPLPRWPVVWAWVNTHVPKPDRRAAADDAERQWLDLLARGLGGDYERHESTTVHLVCEDRGRRGEALLDFATDALHALRDALDGVGKPLGPGRLILVRFTDPDDFAGYARAADPQAVPEWGGALLRTRRPHLALHADRDSIHEVMAHALARALLSHLPLPTWLREGVVTVAGRVALGQRPPPPWDVATWSHHRSVWGFRSLGEFWGGASFASETAGRAMSLQLAEMLVRLMNDRNPEGFNAFLLNANQSDAGDAAAGQYLDATLASFADEVLSDAAGGK